MIKTSTYIREFTPKQRRQLETLQAANPKIRTVPDLLFFALDGYLEQLADVARLNRIIQYKQNKIERLQNAAHASI